MFYLVHFVYVYSFISCLGLIKDIFLQETNEIKSSMEDVVINYRKAYNQNSNSIMWLLPFFILLEFVYYMSYDYSILSALIQVPFYFYTGYAVHRFMLFIMETNNEYKYDMYNRDIESPFVFMAMNRSLLEIYSVYIIPIFVIPITIGANKLTYDVLFFSAIMYIWVYYWNNSFINSYLNKFIKMGRLPEVNKFVLKFTRIIIKLSLKIRNKFDSPADKISDNYDEVFVPDDLNNDDLNDLNNLNNLNDDDVNNDDLNNLNNLNDDNDLNDDDDVNNDINDDRNDDDVNNDDNDVNNDDNDVNNDDNDVNDVNNDDNDVNNDDDDVNYLNNDDDVNDDVNDDDDESDDVLDLSDESNDELSNINENRKPIIIKSKFI